MIVRHHGEPPVVRGGSLPTTYRRTILPGMEQPGKT
jgi:hypothetical protein